MRPLDIKKDVRSFLDNNWTRFQVVGRNEIDSIDRKKTHGVLNFNPGQSESMEVLGATNRPGVFIIQIFTPLGVGTDEGWGHCGRIEEIFLNKNIGSVFFQSGQMVPSSKFVGKDDDLQMLQFNVIIPFSVIAG